MRASLFVTCVVDQFYPEVGESTVRVLRRLGVDVDFPQEQTCCGQTAFNAGFWSQARPVAERFLRVFRDHETIVTPSGSCASMVKVFYKELFHDDPRLLEEAHQIGARTHELSVFIVDLLGITELPETLDAASESQKVTYHEACHLRRELGVTTQPRALIRAAPGAELVEMDRADVCCGFGGSFSVKYPDISGAMMRDKVDDIVASGAEAVVSCDSTCLMQIGGGLDKLGVAVRPIHLAQLLDEATGGGR